MKKSAFIKQPENAEKFLYEYLARHEQQKVVVHFFTKEDEIIFNSVC